MKLLQVVTIIQKMALPLLMSLAEISDTEGGVENDEIEGENVIELRRRETKGSITDFR
jgi:hypothetical protein